MVSFTFLFVGLILIIVGIIVNFSTGNVIVNHHAVSSEISSMIKLGIAGFIAILGLIFSIIGLIGIIRDKNKSKQLIHIAQTGTETDATVTFVDKNYSLLINKQPIYSIVEYKYQDMYGKEHVRRINNISSEYVIRNKIEVGGKVKIKYLQNDPTQSTMLVILLPLNKS